MCGLYTDREVKKGEQKGSKKGRGDTARGFTVPFFRPFPLPFFVEFCQFLSYKLGFFPFCMSEVKRDKKPGRKQWETEKGKKMGVKKGQKREL
jgi:hypothetical protein